MNMSRISSLLLYLSALLLLSITAGAQQPPASQSQNQTSGTDDNWHFGITPYLWFAGMHGTVAAAGHSSSVHASFGDVFKYFNIGLMGAVEARKRRFLSTTDLMWIKLSDDRGIPLNDLGVQSIKVKVNQFTLTPKLGYRVVDREKLKVDALVGLRYWHLGETLEFQPTILNLSASQNWVDALGGGKIELPVSSKATITILGDAGGGGADLDYQVAGILGFKVSKKGTVQVGWRYMDVDYRGNRASVYNVATSGALLGFTFNLK